MHWKSLEFFRTDLWKKTLKNIEGYPVKSKRLRAFTLTPFDKVKVVILGQDPYPSHGMADGLAFSTAPHVKPLPASLRVILKEYCSDLGYPKPRCGDLSKWAKEGVLLINTVLSVEPGKRNSHRNLGWEKLIYEAVRTLSHKREHIVWMLFGKQAQQFIPAIDKSKHRIICTAHPSPLSRGFSGCRCFSHCNLILEELGIKPIDWRLE